MTERWLGADGSLVVREVFAAPEFFDEDSAALFDALGLGARYGDGVGTFDSFAPADRPHDFAALPTDVASVEQFMLASVGGGDGLPPADGPMELATTMLSNTTSSPALRASVLRVLEGLDDVEVVVSDQANPPVVTASFDFEDATGSFHRELVFDAATAHLLTSAFVATSAIGDIPAGTAIERTQHDIPVLVDNAPALDD